MVVAPDAGRLTPHANIAASMDRYEVIDSPVALAVPAFRNVKQVHNDTYNEQRHPFWFTLVSICGAFPSIARP